MSDPRMERLEPHLTRLKLACNKARLDTLLEEGARAEFSFLDFLDNVVGEEVAAKDAKRAIMRTQMARWLGSGERQRPRRRKWPDLESDPSDPGGIRTDSRPIGPLSIRRRD